jgi:YD repeat-containing protein
VSGRLRRRAVACFRPSGDAATTTVYNAAGDVATVTDPNGLTNYTYDGTDANGKTEHRGQVTKVDVTMRKGLSTCLAWATGAAPRSGIHLVARYRAAMASGVLFSEVSDRTSRRLRVARQTYRSAEALATAGVSEADRVSAIVQFDFAVETVIRALLFDAGSHLGAKADPKVQGFRPMLEGAADALRNAGLANNVPGRAGLEHVRSLRNAAQHEARIPTEIEVHECLVYARDAAVEIARLAWALDFLAAETEAIRSAIVKGHLSGATAAEDAGDLIGAMGWLRAAFEHAFTHGGENLVGPPINSDMLALAEPNRVDARDRKADLETSFRRLQTLGRLTAFGINVPLYLRWQRTFIDAPSLNINGELTRYDSDRDWTEHEVRQATAYVIDALLRMEQVVDDVDPGGFRHGGFDKL